MRKIEKEENLTVSKVFNSWILEKELFLKKSTLLKYKNIINTHILPAFGNIAISKITNEMIYKFLIEKQKNGRLDGLGGLKNSYIKSIAIILDACINYAIKMNYRKPLPCKIFKPTVKASEISVLSNNTQRLIETMLHPDNSITEVAILLAYNTGLRIGEICALKREDIDFDNRIIHVNNTVQRVEDKQKTTLIIGLPKTRSSYRKIPMNRNVFDMLIAYKNINKDYYLLSGNNKFLNPRTLEYRFHKVLKQNKIPDFNFHTLRHTFATKCIECGVDVKTLSEIMGHSSVGITLDKYVHPSMENKRKQLEKLVKN